MIEENVKPPSMFDFLESINNHKVDLMVDEAAEKAYDAFMIRRGLGMGIDTLNQSSRMNELHHTTDYMQYHYLLNTVSKKKRFNKWSKKSAISDEVKFIAKFYGVNMVTAGVYCKRMSTEQIQDLRDRRSSGGADKAVKLGKK